MYHFKIVKLDDGGYRFELGAIKMFIDDFSIKDEKHLITTPKKAIGYFSIDGNIYGISNGAQTLDSAEAFYDSMSMQYMIFTHTGRNTNSQNDFRQTA